MRLFYYLSPRRLWSLPWMRIPLKIIGVLCIIAAIWFGLPMTGVAFLSQVWVRLALIALILLPIAVIAILRFRKRRAAAAALEETLVETPVGDGAVLADRMTEALAKLKKSGGATYLYDLPWYVIIGPPGAGKTTALMYSGLEFPGTDTAAIAGFGGTKNCDFWFAEEAVMIDTAGRYTTQDSDVRADKISWQSFLGQLKTARPNQPINGVLLAFSVEDMMTSSDDELDSHALAVRARLTELRETLRIDVPVYVMFTKADKIAGFREFFASYGENRRKSVWGITFQTKDRAEETYRAVPAEFDKLITRLSDEVTDRLNEEPDSAARIALFGFPGQMALLQRNVTEFLRRIFQKSADTGAILRGFYFTSGTQEGTPIDQVLGAMALDTGGMQPSFMSGKGRSFFLNDLLKQVIFAERDWVGYDIKAMRRRALFRTLAGSVMALAVLASFGLFGYSYWQNATLVRDAQAAATSYQIEAQALLDETIISDPATRPVLEALAKLRDMPAGYANPAEQGWFERMGLSRRAKIRTSALEAYSDGLERLLRPRMMLYLENRLPALLAANNIEEAYNALKVYILLGKEQDGRPDDLAIQSYFATAWGPEYSAPGLDGEYREINEHLAAMLELDDRVTPALKPDGTLVTRTQREIATLPLARQAYSSIQSQAASLQPLRLMDEMSGVQAEVVFRTTDGRMLDTLEVPGLYTFTGYWSFFQDAVANAAERLEAEAWVLGDVGDNVDYDRQLQGLNRDLHVFYANDFRDQWTQMLGRIELVPMSSGAPQYPGLAIASAPFASPILKLAETVDNETRLSRFFDVIEGMEVSAEDLANPDAIGGQLAEVGFSEAQRRSGSLQRIALNMLRDQNKFQERAVNTPAAPSQRRQLEAIEQSFEKWHQLVAGAENARPVDILLLGMQELLTNRQLAGRGGNILLDERGMQDALNTLAQGVPFYPETVVDFVNQIESEFLTVTANASIGELSRSLTEEVSAYCTQNVASAYPFAARGARHISTSVFGEFFGYGGRMEQFYETYLREHTQRSPDGAIAARDDSPLGARLSSATLTQFSRAERIKQAFFEPGSATPSVTFSIAQSGNSPTVEGTILNFSGRTAQLFPNATGATFTWPEDTADMSVTFLPRISETRTGLRFGSGRWALMDFITSGRTRSDGTRLNVTHQLDGRSVTFRMEFDSIAVPFLMPELSDFACPTLIE
ncbi:type VI secretion system protein ImpL [Yoonia maricola]|uniref:Type VI secretion system protein ImpL n=1 Tax=Yoonia maricola TaxID=420999 RepID=A0A2M8VZX7_9RHOB|nr:type VI secretion system membrane subunit TssM [Yoonia maricola]PJI84227.1 type VI secretion system protein ImpL [Yoonia maricola]